MEDPTGISVCVTGSTSQAQADRKACSRSGRAGSPYAGKGCFLFALCLVTLIQCPSKPLVTLPAAETPVLETLLDIDNNAIAAFGAPGVFQMLPGQRIELRFRAMYPTNIGVGIEGDLRRIGRRGLCSFFIP
jgi:hypothetical protein